MIYSLQCATTRFGCLNVKSHMPCRAHAVLYHNLEKSLSEGHGRSTAWAWHGKCESNTAALSQSNGKDTF